MEVRGLEENGAGGGSGQGGRVAHHTQGQGSLCWHLLPPDIPGLSLGTGWRGWS